MSILSVENLTKSYGDKVLFKDISFTIADKQRIGLLGVNGTGKSTLLKIIAGIETAENGQVTHANKFQIEYLPQHPALDGQLTILDQIYYGDSPLMKVLRDYEQAANELGNDPNDTGKQNELSFMQQKMDRLNAWDASSMAKTILTRLGIENFSQPVKELSEGQKKRVAIAKALVQPADLLVLDEPTNHLDNDIIEWLERFLSQYQGALLVITHDRYFLNRVTNRILELDQGKLYTYEGNYEAFLAGKAQREEQKISAERKRQNLLRKELAWLRRGAKARSTKQKARVQQVHQIQEQKVDLRGEEVEFVVGSQRLGKKVVELKGVTKEYGGVRLLSDFDYRIGPGERVGIIGPNGAGKTTLLNIMAGLIEPDRGVVEIGQTVKVGYYTQDYVDMDLNLRLIEYIREGADNVKTADGQWITAEKMLETFIFPRAQQWTYIQKLSGGERRRLYLLRILMEEPNVLFLDEPTNDLDTETLAVLEDYLEQFPGVVITVSHDRFFLDRVVDHVIAFENNGIISQFEGNYTEYLEIRKQEQENKSANKKNQKKNNLPTSINKQRPRKLSYKEQREWDEIEDKITSLEQRKSELQKDITLAGSDYERAQELYKEQQQVDEELDQSLERWTELSLLIEKIAQRTQ